jgi:hypothetical protein
MMISTPPSITRGAEVSALESVSDLHDRFPGDRPECSKRDPDQLEKTFRLTGTASGEYSHLQAYNAVETLVQVEWYTSSIYRGLNCSVLPAGTRHLLNRNYKGRVQSYSSEACLLDHVSDFYFVPVSVLGEINSRR